MKIVLRFLMLFIILFVASVVAAISTGSGMAIIASVFFGCSSINFFIIHRTIQ